MKLGNRPRSKFAMFALLIGTALSFVVGDRIISAVLSGLVYRSSSGLAKVYSGRATADVLIVGNSRAIKSFDSTLIDKTLGLKTMNLGVNGIRPELVHAMLRDFIKLNERPEHVIIEVSYLKNEWDDSVGAEFLVWSQFGKETADLLEEKIPRQYQASTLIHLRRFGSQQFVRSFLDGPEGELSSTNKQISVANLERIARSENESFDCDDKVLEELRSIVAQWRQEGVKVHLVLAPYLDIYRSKIININDWIAGVEMKLGSPITDSSDEFGDKVNFSDHVHLNSGGQQIYTQKVIELLLQSGDGV